MQDQPIRVLLVDDHEIVREGLRALLESEPAITVVGEAADGDEAVRQAAALHPDVILMDLKMPRVDGLEAMGRILRGEPRPQILVLTSFAEDDRVRQAIQAGAAGYLLKDVLKRDLVQAIRDASRGRPALHPEVQRQLMQQLRTPQAPLPHDELTPRELDVLRLVARGRSNKEIAASLYLSEGTVKGYVSSVLAKLGVADRTQAALYAVRSGLVPAGDV